MVIRQEQEKDYKQVYQLVKTAFASAQHSDGTEQDLVEALRKSEAFVPELSLVAEKDGILVGHIMFTKVQIQGQMALALAPLSVLPQAQRQGIGTALMRAGHAKAKELGYCYSVVLGSENYYPRVGYVPSEEKGIFPPFDVPKENFMVLELQKPEKELKGVVRYPKEFGL